MTKLTDITLRPWSDGDLPLLQRLLGDPAMMKHLGGPETPEQIRARLGRYVQVGGADEGQMYVIVVGPDQVAAGSIGYWPRTWQGEAVWETGWSVLPELQGQGVATRAVAAVLAPARAAGTRRYLHAFPLVDNGPSNALCRAAGFTRLGPVDFEYPPGHALRCYDWRLDLFAGEAAANA